MPSSDPAKIPLIMRLTRLLSPNSVLDVGCGNGVYGLLFRQVLDLNWGRIKKDKWQIRIDAVEVERDYLNPVHDHVYDKVFVNDWMEVKLQNEYDLIFMGDVLEHFEDWENALIKAISHGKNVIVASPNWKGSMPAQGAWCGYEHERHRVEFTPAMVGGRCLYANSRFFIAGFGGGLLEGRDVLV